ncbi:MAG: histidine phosphatase family protein [Promethearchaeota archaeon]
MIKITYFVHATSIHNEQGLVAGWIPSKISERGIEQAKNLKSVILAKEKTYDVVFSSDLARAFQTAKIVFGNVCEIKTDNRLREINYGDFNGYPNSKLIFNSLERITIGFPSGESYKDVEKRILNFLTYLKENYKRNTIAIFSHRAPQLALDVILKKKSWTQAFAEDWRLNGTWQPGWEYIIE